jgi:hypothetical protein
VAKISSYTNSAKNFWLNLCTRRFFTLAICSKIEPIYQTTWNEADAIAAYTRLMDAGPLTENEEALRSLLEQAYARGLYFDYDRGTQSYHLVRDRTDEYPE